VLGAATEQDWTEREQARTFGQSSRLLDTRMPKSRPKRTSRPITSRRLLLLEYGEERLRAGRDEAEQNRGCWGVTASPSQAIAR
jgi:hypothetical protein